jgi:4-hydroxy-tetrahydrodipicolinate reductase
MKIALIGHGAMGKLIERLAIEKGHEIKAIIDECDMHSPAEGLAEKIKGADVAIDFSVASAVARNVQACVYADVPVVVGTTGWNDSRSEIEKLVTERDGSLVFGANFSIGVNLFYKIAEFAAHLVAKFPEFEAFVEEQHHSRKKDAPSGTALKIKDVVSRHVEVGEIAATRAGNIPGTHRVGFDGPADQILLQHTARSREGFALGAIAAAEWIQGRQGFFEFDAVIREILDASK